MLFGGFMPTVSPFGYDPVLADMDQTPDTQTEKIAMMARAAVLQGLGGGGPVSEIKLTSDQSGASGQNDYFSALGYNA